MSDGSRGGSVRPGPSGGREPLGRWPDGGPGWRSLLFVPGTRPDRYPKALASGADLVCVDLEDAVGPDDKAAARERVMALAEGDGWWSGRSAIRVNPPRTPEGAADLAAVAAVVGDDCRSTSKTAPMIVVAPKVDGPDDISEIADRLADTGRSVRIVAMIETALGLERAPRIARTEHVVALFLGAVDLAAELGCSFEWDALLYARSRLVHAAALAGGVEVLDVPSLVLDDPDSVATDAERVRRLGFTGKAAIHPGQIAPIHQAFTPSPQAVERARRILDAYHRSDGGVTVVDGSMVDRPVVEAARRTLQRASAHTSELNG